jgi:hypothetical protein
MTEAPFSSTSNLRYRKRVVFWYKVFKNIWGESVQALFVSKAFIAIAEYCAGFEIFQAVAIPAKASAFARLAE